MPLPPTAAPSDRRDTTARPVAAAKGGRAPRAARTFAPAGGEATYLKLILRVVNYVWEVDDRGVILRVFADEDRNVLGYPLDRFVGGTLADVGGPDERPYLEAIHASLLESKTDFRSLEVPLRAADGRLIWFELSGVPRSDAEGRFIGCWGMARDIDEQKRAEDELVYRDRLLSVMAQAATELVSAEAVDSAMPPLLGLLGRALDVDRVVVLEAQDPNLTGWSMNASHAWQSAAALKSMDVRARGDTRQAFMSTPWDAMLARGEVVSASADTAVGAEAEVLRLLGAHAILLVPIQVQGRWRGAVALDDNRRPRPWSQTEISAIRAFAEQVGGAMMRRDQQAGQRRAELALKRTSHRDQVTGLPNREAFVQTLRQTMAKARGANRKGCLALHYLDLAHFKDVNDTRGHPAGDQLLRQLGARLRAAVGPGDVVARFGGDEFAVLQMGVSRRGQVDAMCRKLIEVVDQRFRIGGEEIRVGASVGVASCAGAKDAETLLSHAELALYRAKADGPRAFRHYDPSLDAEARSRVSLAGDLRRAIEDDQFFMVYQPQVDLDTGRIVGAEALLRWRHPKRGLVLPNEFIPQAERDGVIAPIGRWVLNEVCRQARAWLRQDMAPPVIAVNLSAVQFRRPEELERQVRDALRTQRLPRGLIQLELTETTLMEASALQSDVLTRLHDAGVRISLDDFGTGYSSLDYLRRYPVDQIKIAQEFVSGCTFNAGDAAIVRAALGLGRELGLEVLAEGVAKLDQVDALKQWGCKTVQGWWFAKAMTAEAIEPLLRQGRILAPQGAEAATAPA